MDAHTNGLQPALYAPCRDLKQAFSLVPEYLKTADKDVNNYMDWGVQLGARFRALKLWFILRSYGVDGIAAILREHCRLAKEFASWIDAADGYERMAPVLFSVVCFRRHPLHIDDEDQLENINKEIMRSHQCFRRIFYCRNKNSRALFLRVAIGNAATSGRHIEQLRSLLQQILL